MPKSAPEDPDFSLSPVGHDSLRGFWPMLLVMLGFTFFSASMWAGGTLGAGLSAAHFIAAVLLGNLLLAVYTGLLAFIAARTRLSTHLLARYAFGERGSALPSCLLGLSQVGWFGVGVAMFALPLQKLSGWNIHLLVGLSGLLMTLTAWVGFRALAVLSFIAVPMITLLGLFSVGTAFTSFGGIDAWFALTPQEPLGFYAAVGICVASFISGGTLTPDFARFSRTASISVVTTVIAFLAGNSLMFFFGAVGAAFYQQADISEVLQLQGMLVSAVIILGLNIWTTNDNALYASGLGFSNITGLPKKVTVVFNGVIGTLLALTLYANFVGFLSVLNVMLPSIGGVLIADFYLVQHAQYPDFSERERLPVRWPAVFAWGCGAAAAMTVPGISALNSIATAALVYVLVAVVRRRWRLKPTRA